MENKLCTNNAVPSDYFLSYNINKQVYLYKTYLLVSYYYLLINYFVKMVNCKHSFEKWIGPESAAQAHNTWFLA